MKISIVIINKNDEGLKATLEYFSTYIDSDKVEVIVVDASNHKLDWIKDSFKKVKWINFESKNPNKISIPEQRNISVKAANGDIIVFSDASCVPVNRNWLKKLTEPILKENEDIVRGSLSNVGNYITINEKIGNKIYVSESPTINMAVKKKVFEHIGYFDENFSYGSDMDFTWRAVHKGYKIRYIESAPVSHDFGNAKQNSKRYINYGKARTKLYINHPYNLSRLKNYEVRSLIYLTVFVLTPIGLILPLYLILPVCLILLHLKSGTIREINERVSFAYGMILGVFDELV